MYDFTTRIDRSQDGSTKWDGMRRADPDVPAGIVPFSTADMEFVEAPEIKRAIHRIADEAVLGYTGPTDAYFEAVLGWQRRRHHWEPERSWVVTCPGVVPALYRAVEVLTNPGDGVIIQPPVYFPFRSSIESTGRTVVENPLRLVEEPGAPARYEMDFEDLERKAADPHVTMLIACSPHNPVGRVWTREELRRMADICLANDVFIVCDEIHNDLVLPGHEHTTLARVLEPAELAHAMVATAPSKTFNLAGVQCSNLFIFDEERRDAFRRAGFRQGTFSLNAFAYPLCAVAYNECESWLDELIGVLDANRRLFCDYVAERIAQLTTFPLEGTYLQWFDCRALGMDADALKAFMRGKARLFMDEGAMFGAQGAGFERINLACPASVLTEALDRLADAVHTLED